LQTTRYRCRLTTSYSRSGSCSSGIEMRCFWRDDDVAQCSANGVALREFGVVGSGQQLLLLRLKLGVSNHAGGA
jgi:hypothetical protein